MLVPCPGCGALFPPSDGPTHRYIGASAGCWALYTPLVAGESPPGQALRGLLVDAYAVQHPGVPSPQAIQSVAVHLLTLHGVLRRGVDPDQALWLRRRALRDRGVFHWLDPTARKSALTIRDLLPSEAAEQPCSVADYARSEYEAWEALHGETIADWYNRYVLPD